jgi:signal transduction histidine kinase
MDKLLAGFLRFSRLGRAAPNVHRLDMNLMLQEIAQTMDYQLNQKGASLLADNLPTAIGDPTQINQVFSNLIDNAVKYLSPERPGRIHVGGHAEGRRAIFFVQDNGIGIPPEYHGKIFEIFHRLDPSIGDGEGLGLTIAQRILERQNGKIWVESNPGSGSRFFVSLPNCK